MFARTPARRAFSRTWGWLDVVKAKHSTASKVTKHNPIGLSLLSVLPCRHSCQCHAQCSLSAEPNSDIESSMAPLGIPPLRWGLSALLKLWPHHNQEQLVTISGTKLDRMLRGSLLINQISFSVFWYELSPDNTHRTTPVSNIADMVI